MYSLPLLSWFKKFIETNTNEDKLVRTDEVYDSSEEASTEDSEYEGRLGKSPIVIMSSSISSLESAFGKNCGQNEKMSTVKLESNTRKIESNMKNSETSLKAQEKEDVDHRLTKAVLLVPCAFSIRF